jgi:glycosyltransferase involved in cell wall biosynthesis/GT2 family glycosyltransferase
MVTAFQQANQLLREGKLEEAVVAYRQAIEQNPQFHVAYQNLGETLGKLGRSDEAVAMYRKAIELKPSAGWLHQELELLLEKLAADLRSQDLSAALEQVSQGNDIPANKNSLNNPDSKPIPASDSEWDTRNCLSITSTDRNIPTPDQIYIVPAIIAERNTTRYRAKHLAELCQQLTMVEIIDYRNLKSNFFRELNKNRNIVIVQRLAIYDKKSESFMNQLRDTSAFIVYDIDDQIFDSSELEDWRVKGLPHTPKQYYHCMQYADQFLVSTKELRNKVETMFNRPVHILQNILNVDLVNLSLFAAKKNSLINQKKFVIGYASGSGTHDLDLDVAINAIDRFLSRYSNAEFHCIGYVNLAPTFKEKHKQKIVLHDPVNWQSLPDILAQFTIQVIPLSSCKFNSYKSQIRYLESSAVGVPVLASNIGEHSQSIIQHYTGYVCDNSDESWYEGLQWYYNNPDKLDLIKKESQSFVLKYRTIGSPFSLWRFKNILQDMSLGVMRDKISIVLVVYNPLHDIKAICESIRNNTNVPFELLIWINSSDLSIKNYIKNLNIENAYIVDTGVNSGKAIAANYLFSIAVERFVVGLDDDYILPQYWAEKMISAAKAVPKLGWLSTNLTEDSSGIRGRGKVTNYSGGISIYLPGAVGGWVVFTTASSREKIGFYREHGLYGGIDGDYNRRARELGLTTGYVRDVVGKHKTQRRNSLAWELFKQRIQDNMRIHGKDSDQVTDKFVDFFNHRPSHLISSIKICTSVTHDENVWGDTHYAAGLKSALETLGYEVRIDKHEEWYSNQNTDDIVIHLFGLHKYKPNPNSINILWIISHIDLLDKQFLIQFDYIFCASEKVTEMVSNLVPQIRVETLLQCTDTRTFYPVKEINKDLDVIFIGNSRRVYRKAVKYCIESGFDLSIWGTRWEEFIDKKYIKGLSLRSEEVADVYRRAKIVLNDHWDDQIKEHVVNNRIFDVLACDTLVVSDFNPGISNIFVKEAPPMFENIEEFKDLISLFLKNNSKREDLAHSLGEATRKDHTFIQRVKAIHNAIIYIIENYVDYKSEMLYNLRN